MSAFARCYSGGIGDLEWRLKNKWLRLLNLQGLVNVVHKHPIIGINSGFAIAQLVPTFGAYFQRRQTPHSRPQAPHATATSL